jgi:hypothetical protein
MGFSAQRSTFDTLSQIVSVAFRLASSKPVNRDGLLTAPPNAERQTPNAER